MDQTAATKKTLVEYRETPYSDSEWEIVGAYDDSPAFEPLGIEIIKTAAVGVFDPMFPDYGGRIKEGEDTSFHAAPGSYRGKSGRPAAEEDEDAGKIKLTQEELDAKLREAEERGRSITLVETADTIQRQQEELASRLKTVLSDLNNQIKENMIQLETKAVELALAISRKLLTAAVEYNPEYIIHIVRQALEHVGGAKIGAIRVSPQDLEFIEVLGVKDLVREFEGITFKGDETIRAGCVVDTTAGEIDFRLDEAWNRVQENVIKVLR